MRPERLYWRVEEIVSRRVRGLPSVARRLGPMDDGARLTQSCLDGLRWRSLSLAS
jgi:hypothetical protein